MSDNDSVRCPSGPGSRKRGQQAVPALRASIPSARERELLVALVMLERANNALCASRSQATYNSMLLGDGATRQLEDLDEARRIARKAISKAQAWHAGHDSNLIDMYAALSCDEARQIGLKIADRCAPNKRATRHTSMFQAAAWGAAQALYEHTAQAIEARQGGDPQGLHAQHESAVSEADAPETEPASPPPSTTEAG